MKPRRAGRIQGTISCGIQARTRTAMNGRFTPTNFELTTQAEANFGNMIANTETRITPHGTGECRR